MNKNRDVKDFSVTFGNNPKRSRFRRPNKVLTAFNTGQLIPVQIDEVLPGDHIDMDIRVLARQTTMIKPVMDGLRMDLWTFYVPFYTIWDDAYAFFGENDDEWARISQPIIPRISYTEGVPEGSIADYLGVPIGVKGLSVNRLPFNAYAKVVADWFRDQNLQKAPYINKKSEDLEVAGPISENWYERLQLGLEPFIIGKFHDYFTSALPGQQKGTGPTFSFEAFLPVRPLTEQIPNPIPPKGQGVRLKRRDPHAGDNYYNIIWKEDKITRQMDHKMDVTDEPKDNVTQDIFPLNLWADMSSASGIDINQLRNLITIQQMLELDARGGTRYVEFLMSHFGVHSSDGRLHRSEYLGGWSQPLNVQQVPQTSGTTESEPQANLAAYGQTAIAGQQHINKTFTEHGYIITLAAVRYHHSYPQGLDRLWTRQSRYDLYDPIFANIGEQPIRNDEIFAQGISEDAETFGFKEAWAEYRYKPNKITGPMRSNAKLSLDVWHYADNYERLPKLSDKWIQEDKTNVDRTLAIKSTGDASIPQFQVDFYFENDCERTIPVYSIPGLKRL